MLEKIWGNKFRNFLYRKLRQLRALLGLPYKDYERTSVRIKIDNLTRPQAKAIEDMLHQWGALAGIGSSRWTAFFADGDGNFHPRISFNGRNPESSGKGKWQTLTYKDGYPDEFYTIDYDWIAWTEREDGAVAHLVASPPMPAG